MKKLATLLLILTALGSGAQEKLIYHNIKTDARGVIEPWYNPDPAIAFDHIIGLVWNFWDTMRVDLNGLPYYMNHQVWKQGYNDTRGLGGDQIQMALSSWRLLYAYSGNERVKQNMKFLADYYLSHSLTPANCLWPNQPFPYNTLIYAGHYDGDMVIGPGFIQPDKSGSLGLELVHLYEMTSRDFYYQSSSGRYLDAAIRIAASLIPHIQAGDNDHSPLPFKVNAFTGETGKLKNNNTDGTIVGEADYTSNWCPTMELFLELKKLDPAHAADYQQAFDRLLLWMTSYPLKTNRWGPFFEDVQGWSDTQINAVTFALFILEHQELFPDWKAQVDGIFQWVYKTVGNDKWKKYGVTVVNEQTVYQTPGESHVARQGATELLYAEKSGDTTRKANAIRELIWATYSVDFDGKNCFPFDEVWLTDGYGDYIRHYLRAMAADPSLAPPASHILTSSSVIQQADYKGQTNKFLVPYVKVPDVSKVLVFYRSFDESGVDMIRMAGKPSRVMLEDKTLEEVSGSLQQGFRWKPLSQGGILIVQRTNGHNVTILE